MCPPALCGPVRGMPLLQREIARFSAAFHFATGAAHVALWATVR
jgi:hypothetical protein